MRTWVVAAIAACIVVGALVPVTMASWILGAASQHTDHYASDLLGYSFDDNVVYAAHKGKHLHPHAWRRHGVVSAVPAPLRYAVGVYNELVKTYRMLIFAKKLITIAENKSVKLDSDVYKLWSIARELYAKARELYLSKSFAESLVYAEAAKNIAKSVIELVTLALYKSGKVMVPPPLE